MDFRATNTSIVSVPPKLAYFCVYNPSLGTTEETQDKQLLFYTAQDEVPINVQVRQTGLAQALVNFTKVFSSSKPCENVHTQKNRLAFLEPEPGYWIHISVQLGYLQKTVKAKDGKTKPIFEYLDENLHDSEIRKMLELGYELFRLFNGTFSSIMKNSGVSGLKSKLSDFYGTWVFEWDWEKTELTKIIDGMYYLPLPGSPHTCVTSLVTALEKDYDMISNTL
ncbi:698_t:CDS:2, partial [Paraglomus occultum]